MTSVWVLPDGGEQHGDLLIDVLTARGLATAADRETYLGAVMADFDPPDHLPGVPEATDRILGGLAGGERIAIYGDYDVDGVTAAAILTRVLRGISSKAEIVPYIPHRIDEGYGLNAAAVRDLHDRGVTLIVTVDCGVTATAEAAVCRELGVDLIITDHHLPGEAELPGAAVIVHPALPGTAYPWPQLSGSAVAYKLARHLVSVHQGKADPTGPLAVTLRDAVCLAGMGVIADVVPLVGENRRLAAKAIRMMRACSLAGIKAMLAVCVKPGESIESETVGFRIGPRLNAAGRMGHAQEALDLLLSDEPEEAAALAKRLSSVNQQRQKLAAEITVHADDMARAAGMTSDDKRMIVLRHEQWHPGVIGIVCSRLMNAYHRPVVLLCGGQSGPLKGSARSIPGYSIHDALQSCGDRFVSFGGHAMAAGVTLQNEDFDDVQAALLAHANAHLAVDDLVGRLEIDCEVELGDLSAATVKSLQKMQPTGRDNEPPCLLARDVVVTRSKVMGRDSAHLELTFGSIRCPWFQHGQFEDQLPGGAVIDVVFEPKIDSWRGAERVQLHIKDVRRH
ncbi:MAG: single-stranded-DNA-specific exonuclease RecJ [Phycisphaerales bacterium]|nr:single-stranded-DNA-specific exonuclease RecJ [Phycisphaerales bacterium]